MEPEVGLSVARREIFYMRLVARIRYFLLYLNMLPDTQLLRLYDYFIDTLIYSCPVFENLNDDSIDFYLAELEGDAHTFLFIDNLIKLKEAGMLDDVQVEKATYLREKIFAIPSGLWRKGPFQTDEQWRVVSLLANDILNSLGISKRKIE